MADRFGIPSDVIASLRSAQFTLTDMLRRAQGETLDRLGFGPKECSYRIVTSESFWRLRAYAEAQPGPCLLIVPAPIKRPYIWDLSPPVSAIGRCLQHGLRVYLLEWLAASKDTAMLGLENYAGAIAACMTMITREAQGAKSFLVGHSLGGTLAAIHCASAGDGAHGLVLVGAPLCFEPASSHFRDALVSIIPESFSFDGTQAVPGSLLSQVSAFASPETFILDRIRDAALSLGDSAAWSIIMRIERWALDEMPLPGRLVDEIIKLLYRENRLCRGDLPIGGRSAGPMNIRVPTLAVVNTTDGVAPSSSVAPFLAAIPAKATRIIEYGGEPGVGLQHLAMLIGREAHARIWPQIFAWMSEVDC